MGLVQQFEEQWDDWIGSSARLAAATMTARLKEAAPVDTGETRDKTEVTATLFSSTFVQLTAKADTPQAAFTNTIITDPIRPVKAKALRFEIDGRVIFAREVYRNRDHENWFSDLTTLAEFEKAMADAYFDTNFGEGHGFV